MYLESEKKLKEHLIHFQKNQTNQNTEEGNAENSDTFQSNGTTDLDGEMVEQTTNSFRWKCSNCPKAFDRRIELQLHQHTHRSEKPVEGYTDDLSNQMVSIKIEPFADSYSSDWNDEQMYNDNDDSTANLVLNDSTENSYNDGGEFLRWACNVCSERFIRRAHLREHKRSHALEKLGTKPRNDNGIAATNKSIKTIIPNVVNRVIKKINKTKMEVNSVVETQFDRWKCKKCSMAFRTRRLLGEHNITHRNDVGAANVIENIDVDDSNDIKHMVFLEEPALKKVINIPKASNSPKKPNLTIKTEPSMNNVKKLSSQSQRWKCSKCRKTFDTRQSLRTHKLNHKFEIKLNLKTKTNNLIVNLKSRHENLFKVKKSNKPNGNKTPKITSSTPTNRSFVERDWKCNNCDAVFNRRSILREHRREVHPSKHTIKPKIEMDTDFIGQDHFMAQ